MTAYTTRGLWARLCRRSGEPDPKTPNESTKIFRVRDPNGHATHPSYNGPTSTIDRWKMASVQDRAGNQLR